MAVGGNLPVSLKKLNFLITKPTTLAFGVFAQSDGLMIYTVWQTIIRVQNVFLYDFKTVSPYNPGKKIICTICNLYSLAT